LADTISEINAAVYAVALGRLKGIGRRTAVAAMAAYPASERLLEASEQSIEALLGRRAASALTSAIELEWLTAVRRAAEVVDEHERRGFGVVGYNSPEYPPLLRLSPDPPAVLFVRGQPSAMTDSWSVAVVGTRNPTVRGAETARRLARRFAEEGAIVVSGLAKGIDTAAHQGALEAGRTVAVLGTAIDKVYPAENRSLADAITEHGALVSEYPIGATSRGDQFVDRDRIQAGLAVAVVPVQTGRSGGTQHTIRFAQAASREILVPQLPDSERFAPENAGIVDLIERKAAVVISADDLPEVVAFLVRSHAELVAISSGPAAAKPEDGQSKATPKKRKRKATIEADTLNWLLPDEARLAEGESAPPPKATAASVAEVVAELDAVLDRLGPSFDLTAFDEITRTWRRRRFG